MLHSRQRRDIKYRYTASASTKNELQSSKQEFQSPRRQHREIIAKPSTHVCLFFEFEQTFSIQSTRECHGTFRNPCSPSIERTKRAATFSIRLHARARIYLTIRETCFTAGDGI